MGQSLPAGDSDRTRVNGPKVDQGKFRFDIKISLLNVRSGIGTGCTTKLWNHCHWKCPEMCGCGIWEYGLEVNMVALG